MLHPRLSAACYKRCRTVDADAVVVLHAAHLGRAAWVNEHARVLALAVDTGLVGRAVAVLATANHCGRRPVTSRGVVTSERRLKVRLRYGAMGQGWVLMRRLVDIARDWHA